MSPHRLAGPTPVEPYADQGLSRRARLMLVLAAALVVVALALGVAAVVDNTVGIQVDTPTSR